MRLLLWRAIHQRSLFSLAVLLAATLAFIGCSESPRFVKPGPLFTAAEKAPPSQAQVYIYWPVEEQSRWNNLLVGSCEGAFGNVQMGGYIRILVSPGRQCLQAEGVWEMESINTTAGLQMARLDLNVKPGQTHFVRIEKGFLSKMALRSVEAVKAEPEIKKCGQMVPMTEDEMRREWQAREAG